MGLSKSESGQIEWKFNMSAIKNFLENRELNEIEFGKPFEGKCLLIYGGKSDYINQDDCKHLEIYFPNIEIHRIPNGNHYLHIQSQEEFLERVNEFILSV